MHALGGVNSFVVSQAVGALTRAVSASPNPVHAATGAKVLGGPEDLDFVLPGVMPVEWQRFYNSRDERRNGLFGAGWSVPYEVSVHIELHPNGGERLIYIDEQARRIDMGSIALGGAVFSAGEGRGVGSPVSAIQKPKLMLSRLSTDTAELQPVKTDIRCQIDVLHDRLPQRSLGV